MTLHIEEQLSPVGDHLVHFFDSEEGLVDAVSGFLVDAATDGDGAIIIAGEAHRRRFGRALVRAGLDLDELERSGRVRLLDAEEALAGFIVDGRPDPASFDRVIGALVESTSAPRRRVRIYGEMVALLWAAGNVSGAMELEQMWNDLSARSSFSLLCAYSADLFSDRSAAEAFADVCHLHTDVLGGAPRPEDAEVERRFPRAPHAPRLARQFVQEVLGRWATRPDTVDDALVVTSELVTNALVHAASDVAVGLARAPGRIRITVSDRSSSAPAARELTSGSLSGRGMAMVSSIASGWGHRTMEGGKSVWADLPTDDEGGRR